MALFGAVAVQGDKRMLDMLRPEPQDRPAMTDAQERTTAALSTLMTWWKVSNGKIPEPSLNVAEVEDIERRYDVTLPEDFRTYLLTTAPAELCWCDNEMGT